MTRDELLLTALAAGATTTAALMRSTGVTERTCRYGLSHLIAIGYAWSPERGRWRLTDAGRALASTLPSPPAAARFDAESFPLPVGEGGSTTGVETAELASPPKDPSGTHASVLWTLAGIAAAVLLAFARRSATPPPEPPAAPPTIRPYDGWRI